MAAGTAPSCWQRGAVSPLGSCVGGSLVEQEQMARRAAARALSGKRCWKGSASGARQRLALSLRE